MKSTDDNMITGLEALKDLKESCGIHMGQLIYILQEDKFDIIEKELKEHEQCKNIEEELGIDLFTFFDAMSRGEVYVKLPVGNISTTVFIVEKDYYSGDFYFTRPIEEDDCNVFWLKDYGKTWALTKEELL